MKLYKTPVVFEREVYFFYTLLGCLLKKRFTQETETNLPENVVNGLRLVDNPYALQQIQTFNSSISNSFAKFYARLLVILCKKSFLVAYIVAKLRLPIFKNAEESVAFFRALYSAKEQRDLCLPRSLFVSSTSKQFKNNGYLFIGVFLPTTQMHAWIIENNAQPDKIDNNWTLYKPVAVICRK